jgi:AcrR family transcriptional regulator
MKQRPITNISIKEICAFADVSRPTFYSYYRNQYELLKSIEDETRAYFEDVVFSDEMKKLSKREAALLIEDVLQYIENESDTIKALLSENGDINFQRQFLRRFTAYLQHVMKQFSEKTSDEGKIEYYSIFVVHGMMALVHHWLKNNMNIPKDELGKIYTEMMYTIF